MKKQIYTLELLWKLLAMAKDKHVLGWNDNDDQRVARFLEILEIGEMVKEEGLEVLIVKRKNGKFVK